MASEKSILRRAVSSRQFLIAGAVLLITACLSNAVTTIFRGLFRKETIKLVKVLDEMPESFGDRFELAKDVEFRPDSGVAGGKQTLSEDVIGSLGTDDYITWFYVDKTRFRYDKKAEESVPTAFVRLHIAYYTGLLDAVPHVADNCMLASGAVADGKPTDVTMTISGLPNDWDAWREVSVRRARFVKKSQTGQESRPTVFYVFSVNGEPVTRREDVRLKLLRPTDRYCYFAKIELSAGQFGGGKTLTVDELDDTCKAFLDAAGKTILSHLPTAKIVKRLNN